MGGLGKLAHATQRYTHQQQRIDKGSENGKLTPREEKRLEKKEAKLKDYMKDAFSDGKITKHEEKKIERMQDRLSKKIYNQKHDKQNGNTPRADKRQGNLESRISKGVESGQLNEREAARLNGRLENLQQTIDAAKADGKVTRGERKEIAAAQNALSFSTMWQKHDKQKIE